MGRLFPPRLCEIARVGLLCLLQTLGQSQRAHEQLHECLEKTRAGITPGRGAVAQMLLDVLAHPEPYTVIVVF